VEKVLLPRQDVKMETSSRREKDKKKTGIEWYKTTTSQGVNGRRKAVAGEGEKVGENGPATVNVTNIVAFCPRPQLRNYDCAEEQEAASWVSTGKGSAPRDGKIGVAGRVVGCGSGHLKQRGAGKEATKWRWRSERGRGIHRGTTGGGGRRKKQKQLGKKKLVRTEFVLLQACPGGGRTQTPWYVKEGGCLQIFEREGKHFKNEDNCPYREKQSKRKSKERYPHGTTQEAGRG